MKTCLYIAETSARLLATAWSREALMKSSPRLRPAVLTGFAIWLALAGMVQAGTNFVITTPGFIYEVNGVPPTNGPGFFTNNCPPLTLYAGLTYTFTMMADSIHPMVVGTNASSGSPPPSAFEWARRRRWTGRTPYRRSAQ